MFFLPDTEAEPRDPEGLVTVARFADSVEAQMARGLLESAGLECVLAGENLAHLMPRTFRMRLQVATADEAIARELLEASPQEDLNDGF